MSMAKFNIEEMVERSSSMAYFMFLGACVNWAKGMAAEERMEVISGCNQKVNEVNNEIQSLEKGRMYGELDEEEAEASCELHSRLDAYKDIRRAMMFPDVASQEMEYLSRSGDFDYEEDL